MAMWPRRKMGIGGGWDAAATAAAAVLRLDRRGGCAATVTSSAVSAVREMATRPRLKTRGRGDGGASGGRQLGGVRMDCFAEVAKSAAVWVAPGRPRSVSCGRTLVDFSGLELYCAVCWQGSRSSCHCSRRSGLRVHT